MIKMMIVDDEEYITNSLYYFFIEQEDMEIESYKAYSAYEAIKLTEKYRFDIILTDICMPGMDGIELMNVIKSRWPACKLIFFTGHSNFEYTYQALQNRDVYYILKSQSYDEIKNTVQKCIFEIKEQYNRKTLLENMERRIERTKPVIEGELIRQLISGEYEINGLEAFRDISFDTEKQSYILLGKIDKNNDFISVSNNMLVFDYIDEILNRDICNGVAGKIRYFRSKEMIWILQAQKKEDEMHVFILLSELIGKIQSYVCDSYHISISFGVCTKPCATVDIADIYTGLRHRLLEEQVTLSNAVILYEAADMDPNNVNFKKYDEIWDMLLQGNTVEFIDQFKKHTSWMRITDDFDDIKVRKVYFYNLVKIFDYVNNMGKAAYLECDMQKLFTPELFPDWNMAFSVIVDTVSNIQKKKEDAKLKDSSRIIEATKEYIRVNYNSELSLTSVAEYLHINHSYLSYLFKNITGKNFQKYINDIRIEEACKLLLTKNLKITEVASLTGFGSAKYFISVFKKSKAITPQEWRNIQHLT